MFRLTNISLYLFFIFMLPSLRIRIGDRSKPGKSVSGKISTITRDAELETVAGREQEIAGGGGGGVAEESKELFFCTSLIKLFNSSNYMYA